MPRIASPSRTTGVAKAGDHRIETVFDTEKITPLGEEVGQRKGGVGTAQSVAPAVKADAGLGRILAQGHAEVIKDPAFRIFGIVRRVGIAGVHVLAVADLLVAAPASRKPLFVGRDVYPSREPVAGHLRQVNPLHVVAFRTFSRPDGDDGPFTVEQRDLSVRNHDAVAVFGSEREALRVSGASDACDQGDRSHRESNVQGPSPGSAHPATEGAAATGPRGARGAAAAALRVRSRR